METKTTSYMGKSLEYYVSHKGMIELNTKDFCEILGEPIASVSPSRLERIQLPFAITTAAEKKPDVKNWLLRIFGDRFINESSI